ncbi:hypothetical protein AMK16_01840 [Streptomyces sp. CB00455]|uniref:hypothetical protein n=1 Tax=Streptomyces sp. CB00455 TaxID=1703927 RepID=UPI00093FA4FC|nr:hypothetical protein [Streptomyces sp. CB00455]OKK22005.1 hypothetical protein AMK16_01840 [Streptomyces sp. CB00455]
MTATEQPAGPPPTPEPPPLANRPAPSEVTRLLCAGVYFDGDFRRRVIEQLVEHEERPAPPSLGVDAVPVLAHALRARRRECAAGFALGVLWALFIGLGVAGVGSQTAAAVPLPWFLAYGVVCVVSWGVGGGRGTAFTLDRAVLRRAVRGSLKAVLPVVPLAVGLLYWGLVVFAVIGGADAWAAFVFPALMVLPVAAYRVDVVSVMRHELSREAHARSPRRELPDKPRYRRIGEAVDREQYATLAVHDPLRPFVGVGEPYKPWSLVMELERRKPPAQRQDGVRGDPLTGREVLDLIRPRLEDLRTSTAATSRDRLRFLEIDEIVYLCVGAAGDRFTYHGVAEQHLEAAAGEGDEERRHFLRVRVGAWDEQIALSLLVGVHTQGGMLVLEVLPHVLRPVRAEFRAADVVAARAQDGPLRDVLVAVFAGASANCAAGFCLAHTALSVFRTWLTGPEYAEPDGPVASVRELGSAREVSLLQEMDVSRYVRTLQDRIASGVREALRAKGYETGEFEQHIVTVSGGGVFIGEMSGGAVATGDRASAKHVQGDAEAKRGRT